MKTNAGFGIVLFVILLATWGCTEPAPPAEAPTPTGKTAAATNSATSAKLTPTPAPAKPDKNAVSPETPGPASDEPIEDQASPKEAEEQPADTDPELTETEGVMLAGITLATGVEKRKPIAPGTSFTIGAQEKIYAILDVKNPSQEESKVTVSWLRPGATEAKWGIDVTVGAQKKWRTWAFTRNAKKAGLWTVQITDTEGTIIGKAPFTMIPQEN